MVELMALAFVMHNESTYKTFNFNAEKTRNYIETVITNESGLALVYVNKHGNIIGGILGWISEHWFGSDKLLCDIALFINPSVRGGIAAARLIKAFIKHGEHNDCKQVILSNSTGYQKDRVGALYERMGMEQVGYVYVHNCNKE
jgi:hypothetical protein